MEQRNKITDALMRMFTPETAGQNFGSPQDDPEGWARAVRHQGAVRDATREGMDMPPDPRARGFADQGLREAASTGYASSPYPPTERDAQRGYAAQSAYSADQVMRNSPSFRQGVMMPSDLRAEAYRRMRR